MTYTESSKKSIYKWRQANKDEFNQYMGTYMNNYYKNHSDYFRKKRMDLYYYKKETQIFRNILIDGI